LTVLLTSAIWATGADRVYTWRADVPKLRGCGESGRIVGKDKVAIGERVTPKAGLMQSLVVRFAVGELRETPTAGRSIKTFIAMSLPSWARSPISAAMAQCRMIAPVV
jgi:hypothetical protein